MSEGNRGLGATFALLPGALLIYLAFNSGGIFGLTTAFAVVLVLAAAAVCAVLAPLPLAGLSPWGIFYDGPPRSPRALGPGLGVVVGGGSASGRRLPQDPALPGGARAVRLLGAQRWPAALASARAAPRHRCRGTEWAAQPPGAEPLDDRAGPRQRPPLLPTHLLEHLRSAGRVRDHPRPPSHRRRARAGPDFGLALPRCCRRWRQRCCSPSRVAPWR